MRRKFNMNKTVETKKKTKKQTNKINNLSSSRDDLILFR